MFCRITQRVVRTFFTVIKGARRAEPQLATAMEGHAQTALTGTRSEPPTDHGRAFGGTFARPGRLPPT